MNRAERILLGVITLLTVAAGVARYASGVPDVAAFILAGLALAGLGMGGVVCDRAGRRALRARRHRA